MAINHADSEVLSERKKKILKSSIEDYIYDALPITSGAVQSKYLKNISSATLRNELSALEAMGYLKQVHTSGGRVPTSKAYRFYVNNIISDVKFDSNKLAQIKDLVNKRTKSLNEIVTSLATEISKITNLPSVVKLNGPLNLLIESMRIIPLITNEALVLIQTNAGIINNSISLKKEVTEENCLDASRYLTRIFKGQTIGEMIKNMGKTNKFMKSDISAFSTIIESLVDNLENMISGSTHTISKTKLLTNPEYSSLEKAKQVLEIFEDEEEIAKVLDEKSEDDISFSIGKENDGSLSDVSIAKANVKVNGQTIASIGVIGPERMNYAVVASALKFVVDEMKKLGQLEHKKGDDN